MLADLIYSQERIIREALERSAGKGPLIDLAMSRSSFINIIIRQMHRN